MNKIIKTVFLVASCLLVTTIFADDNNIGILDIEKLMAKTGMNNQAMNKIKTQYDPEIKALEREERVLKREVKKYNRSSDQLSPTDAKHWQRKINVMQERLQQKRAILQDNILAAQDAATQSLISRFFSIVSKISGEHDLNLVFFADVAIYNSNKVDDITYEVIKRSAANKAKSSKKNI